MAKYVIGAIIIICLAIGGLYYFSGKKGATLPTTTTQQVPAQVATTTYATSTYSVVYPVDYAIDAAFQNVEVNAKKPISGVKLTIPGTMATGTNLGVDTFISVEQLPRAKNCTGDIYLADTVKPTTVTEGGVTYSLATTSGAGAGNLYEESVYAIEGSKPCTAVRYWIHSSNIGNYDPGTVREFDRNALIQSFDTIRRSVQVI